MSDLKLEVGKKYWTRNGQVRTVTSHDAIDMGYPWMHQDQDGNGAWCTNTGTSAGGHVGLDLVREFTAEDELREQTIETFAVIVRNGGKVPDGMQLERYRSDIDDWAVPFCSKLCYFTSRYRLVPIAPPAPEMVPLEADDIPPGSVVRLAEGGWLNIAEVTDDGITVNSISPDHISYADLKGDEWQILRPGQTWTRCEKAAT